jgi:hypothetical protein
VILPGKCEPTRVVSGGKRDEIYCAVTGSSAAFAERTTGADACPHGGKKEQHAKRLHDTGRDQRQTPLTMKAMAVRR